MARHVRPIQLATIALLSALAAASVAGCRRKEPPRTSSPAAGASGEGAAVSTVKVRSVRCPEALVAAREGGLDEGRYVVPTDAERRAIREAVAAIMNGGDGHAKAAEAGFEIVDLPEQRARLLREIPSRKRGGGAYVLRPDSSSRLFVQAPHGFYDEGTFPLACELFERADAGALFVDTAHRYRGAPQAPNGSWPADVAHARDSLFQAATEGLLRALRQREPRVAAAGTALAAQTSAKTPVIVQLHGFAEREAGGSMVISAGLRTPGAPLVSRAAIALGRLTKGVQRYPEDQSELGATTNVQGAIVREASGQFLHIEIGAPLRRQLLDDKALRASFLATLADALEGA